jgi:hypothetical protein
MHEGEMFFYSTTKKRETERDRRRAKPLFPPTPPPSMLQPQMRWKSEGRVLLSGHGKTRTRVTDVVEQMGLTHDQGRAPWRSALSGGRTARRPCRKWCRGRGARQYGCACVESVCWTPRRSGRSWCRGRGGRRHGCTCVQLGGQMVGRSCCR